MDLLKMIDYQNTNEIRAILDKNGPSDDWDFSDYYALRYAVCRGNLEIVNLLLEYGCRVNKTGKSASNTPLHIAVKRRRVPIVRKLLDEGALIDQENINGETPLHFAMKTKHNTIINLLLEKCNLDPFYISCILGDARGVDEYLRSGISVNKPLPPDASVCPGYPPLHLAVEFDQSKIVQSLLRAGANVTTKNSKGLIAVNLAARLYRMDILERILQTDDCNSQPFNPIDDHNFSHFHAACMTTNLERVEKFLRNGVDVNDLLDINSNWPAYSPLHLATKHSSVEVVQLLLDHGADANHKNLYGETPLHFAVERNDKSIIDALLSNLGNSPIIANPANSQGLAHFHVACMHADPSVVMYFLKKGAAVDQTVNADLPQWPQYTPLHFAVMGKRPETIRLLLEYGADVNAFDANGSTPLHLAAQHMGEVDVRILLDGRAQVDAITDTGTTALHLAVQRGHYRIARLLSRYKASVNIPEKTRRLTALHYALMYFRNFKIVDLLLKRRADINAADADGVTPVQLALDLMDSEVMRLFVESGADVNARYRDDMTMLHMAVKRSCKGAVQLLLDRGVDTSAVDSVHKQRAIDLAADILNVDILGIFVEKHYSIDDFTCGKSKETLLHKAAYRGDFEAVKWLIKKNADVNSRTKPDESTPLHDAVSGGCAKTVELLLDHGADVNAVDSKRRTPLFKAVSDSNVAVMEVLLRKNSNVDLPNIRNLTPLQLAAFHGDLERVELLLKYNAYVNAGDRTALHLAVAEGHEKIVEALLKAGADPNGRTIESKTPLHFMLMYNTCMELDSILVDKCDKIIKLLLDAGCDVDAKDREENTPLFYSKPSAAMALLQNGADINLKNTAKYATVSGVLRKILQRHKEKLSILHHFLYGSELAFEPCECRECHECFFRRSCEVELMRMQNIVIDPYSTLLSLIFKSATAMAIHVKNRSFLEIVESRNFNETYPHYGYLLKLQFRKGMNRRVFFDPAKYALDKIFNMTLPEPCLEAVIIHLNDCHLQDFINFFPELRTLSISASTKLIY